MMSQPVTIGRRLNDISALQLAADLSLTDLVDAEIAIDFRETVHFEPFAMLFASSAIRRLRRKADQLGREIQLLLPDGAAASIAGRLGFWQACGVDCGSPINSPANKTSYLPIRRISVADLYQKTGGLDPVATGDVEMESNRLAVILTQPTSAPLLEALTYSFRELIRNVFDHAQTGDIWVSGMSWPKRNLVEVAVLDEGVGVRASLATNQTYRYDTDLAALEASLQPGVSRNAGRPLSERRVQELRELRPDVAPQFFQNAGQGLSVIRQISAASQGKFLIASGSAYVAVYGRNALVPGTTAHHGTAIRISFEPSEVAIAMDEVFEGNVLRGAAGRKPMISASTLRRFGLDSLVADGPDPDAETD